MRTRSTRFAYLLPAKKVTAGVKVPLVGAVVEDIVVVVIVVDVVVEPDIEYEYSTLGRVEI